MQTEKTYNDVGFCDVFHFSLVAKALGETPAGLLGLNRRRLGVTHALQKSTESSKTEGLFAASVVYTLKESIECYSQLCCRRGHKERIEPEN